MNHFTEKLQVKVTCNQCGGGPVVSKMISGYISAQDLGRARGAKGKETFHIEDTCQNCGITPDVTVDEFHLCWICGQRASRSVSGFGAASWVPGVPSDVPLCSAEQCEKTAVEEIARIDGEAFYE